MCEQVEEMIWRGERRRQWHSHEILDEISGKNWHPTDDLNPYVLDICLAESARLVSLNRMVWVRSDSGLEKGDRLPISDMIVQILKEEGKPLSDKELRERISEKRGISRHMLVKMNAGDAGAFGWEKSLGVGGLERAGGALALPPTERPRR